MLQKSPGFSFVYNILRIVLIYDILWDPGDQRGLGLPSHQSRPWLRQGRWDPGDPEDQQAPGFRSRRLRQPRRQDPWDPEDRQDPGLRSRPLRQSRRQDLAGQRDPGGRRDRESLAVQWVRWLQWGRGSPGDRWGLP